MTITLNRPSRLNALSVPLLRSFVAALRSAQANESTRVVILQSTGERAFCAGEDLKETLAPETGSSAELTRSLHALQDITRLTSMNPHVLLISAVQGWAIGGGAEIALAADFVIGSPNAKFKFPEVGLGHAATGGITGRLVSMVGLLKAKELLITGRTVGSEEALRMGLLTNVVEDPKRVAGELARELVGLPKRSVEGMKGLIEDSTFPKMEGCLEEEVRVASRCFEQVEAERAFEDFKRRREKGGAEIHGKPQPGRGLGTQAEAATGRETEPSIPSIDRPLDLNAALALAVKRHASTPFLRFTATGQDITFTDFDREVSKLAGGLSHLGIGPGDRVLVMKRNSLEAVQLWFAANRLGAIWVPINTELKSLALKGVVAAAGAKIAAVDADLQKRISETGSFPPERIYSRDSSSEEAADGIPVLSSLFDLGNPITEPPSPIQPSTISALLYTSGTTGPSKPCALSHAYFLHSARNMIHNLPLLPTDVLFSPFPLFHADATNFTIIPALLMGTTAALSPRFSASRFWDEIREAKGTVFSFMGATLTMLWKNAESTSDRDHQVRLAWGVPVPAWAEGYEKRFGHEVRELYGSVETGLPIIQNGPRVLGSCGKAIPGYTIRIADEYDESLPPNAPGNLLIRAEKPNAMFAGYFNDSIATVATYANTWLHTGDIARVDEEGNVFFLGRRKDVIRRRGENISTFSVEEEVQAHPEVKLCAAIAVPSSLGGVSDKASEDDVKIIVEVRSKSGAEAGFSEEDLWLWCREKMSRFMVPSIVEFVDEGTLPRTETGKVVKRELKVDGGKRFDNRAMR